MQYTEKKGRLYKFALILFTGFLFFGALYYARDFLIPLSIAALLSMLMLPVNRKFESWGLARAIAIILCIVIIILVVAGFIFFFYTQVENLIQDLPSIKKQLDKQLEDLQLFIQKQAGISPEKQITYLKDQGSTFFNSASQHIRNILMTTTETLAETGLVIIYMFFFLYYRHKFETFLFKLANENNNQNVKNIIRNTAKVTQQYLGGKLIVTIILSVYNIAGLTMAGLDHAIFWGVFAAILNFIPYIGTFLGGFLPFLVAIVTFNSLRGPLTVAAIFISSQFFDNNFLTPLIIGSKVDLNPLFTIMVLIVGGLLWGVAGLILFIPFLGIAKVIFDNIPSLQPYGYLIGDENKSTESSVIEKIKEWFRTISL